MRTGRFERLKVRRTPFPAIVPEEAGDGESAQGGEVPGRPCQPGRDSKKKVPVTVALELNYEGKPTRVAMANHRRDVENQMSVFCRKRAWP